MPWTVHPSDPNHATFDPEGEKTPAWLPDIDHPRAPRCQHAYDPDGATFWPMAWHATRVAFALDEDGCLDTLDDWQDSDTLSRLLSTGLEFNCTPVTLYGLEGAWIVFALPSA